MPQENKHREDSDAQMKALRHPLRRELMKVVLGTEGTISPRELASRVFQPLSNVSYHVRVLADCNAVKLVRTRPVRGSMQHFYRADENFKDSPLVAIVLGLKSSSNAT